MYCTGHGILYMARVKLVLLDFFYKGIFNQFENIPPQNKDTEALSVRKMCLINFP